MMFSRHIVAYAVASFVYIDIISEFRRSVISFMKSSSREKNSNGFPQKGAQQDDRNLQAA